MFVDSTSRAIVKFNVRLHRKKAISLRLSSKMIRKGNARARASSLAMLCLIAHALFVCVTHHHDANRNLLSTVSITASGENNSNDTPDAKGDSHCLSCRLQSNFISDAHTGAIAIEPTESQLIHDVIFAEPHSRLASLAVFGRAPPLS